MEFAWWNMAGIGLTCLSGDSRHCRAFRVVRMDTGADLACP